MSDSVSFREAVGDALAVTMFDSKSYVERGNLLLRILAVVGGSVALWAHYEGHTELLHQVGWATVGVTGVSFLVNFHTVYKEYKRERSTAGSITKRFLKESVKTGVAPLVAPISVLVGALFFAGASLGLMGSSCSGCCTSCDECEGDSYEEDSGFTLGAGRTRNSAHA